MGLRRGCCCTPGRDEAWLWSPGEQTPGATWLLQGSLVCEALLSAYLHSSSVGTLIPPSRDKVLRNLGMGQGAACCSGQRAGGQCFACIQRVDGLDRCPPQKGTCQPHLLAGWGLLPVFLPRQAGRSPVPICGQYHSGRGMGSEGVLWLRHQKRD